MSEGGSGRRLVAWPDQRGDGTLILLSLEVGKAWEGDLLKGMDLDARDLAAAMFPDLPPEALRRIRWEANRKGPGFFCNAGLVCGAHAKIPAQEVDGAFRRVLCAAGDALRVQLEPAKGEKVV